MPKKRHRCVKEKDGNVCFASIRMASILWAHWLYQIIYLKSDSASWFEIPRVGRWVFGGLVNVWLCLILCGGEDVQFAHAEIIINMDDVFFCCCFVACVYFLAPIVSSTCGYFLAEQYSPCWFCWPNSFWHWGITFVFPGRLVKLAYIAFFGVRTLRVWCHWHLKPFVKPSFRLKRSGKTNIVAEKWLFVDASPIETGGYPVLC